MAAPRDLGTPGVATGNPATSVSMTSGTAVADGESVHIGIRISNDNPTFGTAPTFAGHNMAEVLRMAKTGTGTVVVFAYKNTTGSSIASGASFSATWTNTGTTNGGGAECNGLVKDALVDPTVADTTGTGQGTSTTPTSTTGTPSSSTKDYYSFSSLGGLVSITAAGQATPPAGYTAASEGFNSTRTRSIYSAGKVLTQPVSAETVAWSQTWGAAKQWAEVVALFELAAGGVTVTAGAATATGAAPAAVVAATVAVTATNAAGSTPAAVPVVTRVAAVALATGSAPAAAPAATAAPAAAIAAGSAPAPVRSALVAIAAATSTGAAPAPTIVSGSGATATPTAALALGSTPQPVAKVAALLGAAAAAGTSPTPALLARVAALAATAAGSTPNAVALAGVVVTPGQVTILDGHGNIVTVGDSAATGRVSVGHGTAGTVGIDDG